MDTAALVIIAGLGVVVGLFGAVAWWQTRRISDLREVAGTHDGDEVDRVPISQLLGVLPGASILVHGSNGTVERATAKSFSLGLVVSNRLASEEMNAMVAEVHRDGITREYDINITRPALARGELELRVRAAAVGEDAVLLLIDDLSGARRVDTVRRDFVANVSHELKTPVGALSLLAEAVSVAADDPDEVRHFADRMTAECSRLSHLVADLIDLSRLQGDQPLDSAQPVSVGFMVSEAIDMLTTAATKAEIDIVVGGERELQVYGVEDQLITALRNLLANAIAYSPAQTKVAIGVAERDGIVNISVTDQGIGIDSANLDRIFERFYRVDPARSRITGGTGLGLAIVKHVCNNHGGDVTVWSVEGEGSTFTLRLPAYRAGSDSTSEATADPEGIRVWE
ncbi:MAG: two-component sensor histidine kinase [Actinobacteria bacterium]|nr:two-component sensor histidine kinase [Actinomycetota bacterium]MCB9411760.1 two-component sensor histidine kinase [Actinomycetota bacterium]